MNLFVDNDAGELLYFLMVVGMSLIALLMAFDQSTRSKQERAARRYTVALAGLMLAWGALTGVNLITLLTDGYQNLLPPLERATTALFILLLSWPMLTADSPGHEHAARRVVLVLVGVVVLGYVYTAASWESSTDFNRSTYGLAWTLIPLLFVGLALLALMTRYRHTADIPLKLLFWGVLLAGHLYTLYRIGMDDLSGDEAGTVRLSLLAASPVMLVILYRLVIDRFREAVEEISGFVPAIPAPAAYPPPAPPPPQYIPIPTPNPAISAHREAISLLKIMGMMMEETQPEGIPGQIARAVANTLKADIVALAAIEEANWANTLVTYDSLRETRAGGLSLNLTLQPTLTSAIEHNAQRILPLDKERWGELSDLYYRLDSQQSGLMGVVYMQPLSHDRRVIGVLLLAMPYSNRQLDAEELALLEALAPIAARLLTLIRNMTRTATEAPATLPEEGADGVSQIRAELQSELEKAQTANAELSAQIRGLQADLQRERDKLDKMALISDSARSVTEQIKTISAERLMMEEERERLMAALQQAQTTLASATADTEEDIYQQLVGVLEAEKAELLAEKATLENELRQLQEITGQRQSSQAELEAMLQTVIGERDRLARDHARLNDDLGDAHAQLAQLGIEAGAIGLGRVLAHLTEERARFLAESKRLRAERDRLLREREKMEDTLQQTGQITAQIDASSTEIIRMAHEREVLIRQRDALKAERDLLNQQRDEWLNARVSLTERYDSARRQLTQAREQLAKMSEERAAFEKQVRASAAAAMSADAFGVQRQLQDVAQEAANVRGALEAQLAAAQAEISRLEGQLHDIPAAPMDDSRAQTILELAQEVRTPVSSAIGYTDLLLSESLGILNAPQRQFLSRIKVNSEQVMNVVEQLLGLLHIDFGTLSLLPQEVEMLDIIDDAITASSAQYRQKGLSVNLDVADDLPHLRADRDALQQALAHLLTNAYLASPSDSAVTVTARHIPAFERGEAPQNVLYLSVTDQGGGVPPAEAERVFKRQTWNKATGIPGLGDQSGVGLSIAQALIRAHGGDIWLESGGGRTAFHFYIPLDHPFEGLTIQKGNIKRMINALESRKSGGQP